MKPLTMSAEQESLDRRRVGEEYVDPSMRSANERFLSASLTRAHAEIDALRAALSGSPDEPTSPWKPDQRTLREALHLFDCCLVDYGETEVHALADAIRNMDERAGMTKDGHGVWHPSDNVDESALGVLVAQHYRQKWEPHAVPALASPDEPRATDAGRP